jgi:exonuclease III
MKIVSWNCCNGFNKDKTKEFIEILKDSNNYPDVLIIQECTQKDYEDSEFDNKNWFGDGKDSYKGIGIFSNKYKIERTLEHNINFRYVVPYRITDITDKNKNFILFSVWTKNVCCDYPYIGQIYGAINYPGYRRLLNDHVVIIGDFNANKIWDNDNIKINNPTFSEVVNILNEKGIHSLYHKFFSCEYGGEKHWTHFNSGQKKYYHIDYCFSTDDMKPTNIILEDEQNWEIVKESKKWKKLSDHSPLIAEFNF